MFYRGECEDVIGPSPEWSEGYRAWAKIAGFGANPYPEGSLEHSEWKEGYGEAAKDDDCNEYPRNY